VGGLKVELIWEEGEN